MCLVFCVFCCCQEQNPRTNFNDSGSNPIGKMCTYYFQLNVFVYHWLLTIQMFDVHAYVPDREDVCLDDTTSFHWYGKPLLFQSRKSWENFESVWEKSGIKNPKDFFIFQILCVCLWLKMLNLLLLIMLLIKGWTLYMFGNSFPEVRGK